MSSAAHRGDHDVAFYEAAIKESYVLSVGTSLVQTSDADGPLRPGRYLIQLVNPSSDTALCWVHVGKFAKGTALAGGTGAGRNRIPLSRQAIVAVETHVLKDDSDRIGAEMTAGSATLIITRVSTEARNYG